ncbi:MAG: hypothetical protein WA175_10225 [Candidatus Acidiferrales bacterium]
MAETNSYAKIARDSIKKLEDLYKSRELIDVEIVKLEQFISATANLLPDQVRNVVDELLENTQEIYRIREAGLTGAIQKVLRTSPGQWLTVAEVRDRLVSLGFDFSTYTTNPLASISTTLKRIKSADITTRNDDGVKAYKWAGELPLEAPKFLVDSTVLLDIARKKK